MPRRWLGWGIGLGLFASGLSAQTTTTQNFNKVQLSGRVHFPAAATRRLPGALATAAPWPAAVYLVPARPAPAAARVSALLRVTWNHLAPPLLTVPAGARVVFENDGTVAEPLELLRPRGQRHFLAHCAICHGANGEALTPVGGSMRPHAENLLSPGIQTWNELHLAQVVWGGKAGSGMPRWQRVLSYPELRRIVHYVKLLPAMNAGTVLPPPGAESRRAAGWLSESLGRLAPGESRIRAFLHPGIYPLAIQGQSNELAYIVVAPSPYCAITDAAGNYRLPPAPPGDYQLVAWHPGSVAVVRNISLRANTQLSLNLH